MSKEIVKPKHHVGALEMAEILGVTRNTVFNWVKIGMPYVKRADPERKTRWVFDTADVIAWRELQAAQTAIQDTSNVELEDAKRRKLAAEASLAELALSKARADAISIKDVEKAWSDIVTTFRSKMLSLPQKLAPIVAGETQERRVLSLLQADVFEALNELSRYSVDLDGLSDDN